MTVECKHQSIAYVLETIVKPVIGVLLLDADHSVETLDMDDPFSWQPPAGLTPGFYGHPDAWPNPVVFAVPVGATAKATADGDPAALQSVADAVARLDGRCDVIVGSCGFFSKAWDYITEKPTTTTLLSGFDLMDHALASTSRGVVVLSFSNEPAERVIAQRADGDRISVVGISPAGDWPLIGRLDWAVDPQWTLEGLESGLREVLARETAPGGKLVDAGAIVLECTILPQFRSIIREFTAAPIFDVGAVARDLIA